MYKSLQAGRALAAMAVVLFHVGAATAAKKYFGLKLLFVPFSFGGAAGVAFFFVLSGFIILTAHRGDLFAPRKVVDYLRKRFIRIYPTYWLIFLSTFLLALAVPALRHTVPHDLALLLKSVLLVPQDKHLLGGSGAPVICVAWTLQYEMVFYLSFALLILSRWFLPILAAAWLAIYLAAAGGGPPAFPLSFFAADYLWLFVIGMLVSVVCASRQPVVARPMVYVVAGAALFLLVAADVVLKLHLLREWKTLWYGLAGGVVVLGLVQAEDRGLVIGGHRWLQLLGDSSYALYLIHYPLISVLCQLSVMVGLRGLGLAGAVMSYLLIFAACLVTAVAFHVGIERPVIAFLRQRKIDLG